MLQFMGLQRVGHYRATEPSHDFYLNATFFSFLSPENRVSFLWTGVT